MRTRGFTLIELMIVTAIIALLAAIALPLYQNYIVRSHITRVMGEAGRIIPAVEVCISEGRTQLGTAVGECDPGAAGSSLMSGSGNAAPGVTLPTGTDVPTIAEPLSQTATITATFGNGAHLHLTGATIIWSRDTNGTWTCQSTVGAQWAPTGCPN